MNIQHIKYACEVARCGSINKAAQNLFITQPHLSSCLKELEQDICRVIFKRTPRGIEVTDEGKDFLNNAYALIENIDEFEQRYDSVTMHRRIMHIVSVRTALSMQAYLEFYNHWYEACECYQLRFIETDFFSLVEACSRGEARVGVMVYFTGQRDYIDNYISIKNLELCELEQFPVCITLSRRNPALRRGKLDMKRVQDLPCATYSDYMDSILNISNECKLVNLPVPRKMVYVHDRHALFRTLSKTDAYAVSARFLKEDCETFKLTSIPIDCESQVHAGYIKTRNYIFRDDSMEMHFINALKESIDKFSRE